MKRKEEPKVEVEEERETEEEEKKPERMSEKGEVKAREEMWKRGKKRQVHVGVRKMCRYMYD